MSDDEFMLVDPSAGSNEASAYGSECPYFDGKIADIITLIHKEFDVVSVNMGPKDYKIFRIILQAFSRRANRSRILWKLFRDERAYAEMNTRDRTIHDFAVFRMCDVLDTNDVRFAPNGDVTLREAFRHFTKDVRTEVHSLISNDDDRGYYMSALEVMCNMNMDIYVFDRVTDEQVDLIERWVTEDPSDHFKEDVVIRDWFQERKPFNSLRDVLSCVHELFKKNCEISHLFYVIENIEDTDDTDDTEDTD